MLFVFFHHWGVTLVCLCLCSELCVPYKAAKHDVGEHRTIQCRYKTQTFSIGIKHTVFFHNKKTPCLSVPHQPLDLSQLCEFGENLLTLRDFHNCDCLTMICVCFTVRARTPVNLSTQDEEGGGRWISWSSPYPSSSSLNKHINYQLGYRVKTQDNWTVRERNTSLNPNISAQSYTKKRKQVYFYL